MNALTLITKLNAALAPLAKDISPDGMMAAPGAAAPQMTGGTPVEQLGDVYERLGALLKKAGQTGTMPDGSDSEIKTLAGILLALVGGEEPGEMEEAPAPEGGVPSAEKRANSGEGDMEKSNKTFASADEFAAWSLEQIAAASKEEPSVALKRIENLTAAVKLAKSNFEQTGAEPKPLTIEMFSAFAGLPGAPMDLSTKADQEDEGGGAGGSAPSNASTSQDSQFAANAGEVLGKALAALAKEFESKQTPGTPSAAASDGATALSKRDDDFVFPRDMADYERDEDGARVRRTKMDDALPKRVTKSVSSKVGLDDSWGADPWAKR